MKYDREASIRKYEEAKAKHFELVKLIDHDALLDEDGYPTEYCLHLIEKWHWSDDKGWFKLINQVWHLKSWGWTEQEEKHEIWPVRKVKRLYISTAGWSGNESIIRSMEKNEFLWHLVWYQSKRGGHYIFELNEDENETA